MIAQQAERQQGGSTAPLVSVEIQEDADAVFARQRARLIADQCQLDSQSQTRFATAVSELARNIHQYAGRGRIQFSIDLEGRPQAIVAEFIDQGPGIAHLDEVMSGLYQSPTGMGVGLIGAKRLMDSFQIESVLGKGTRILVRKNLPHSVFLTREAIAKIAHELLLSRPRGVTEEVLQQNRELLLAMEKMTTQGEELAQLNRELAETNSGVLALYSELDEKATSLQRANQVKTNFLSHMTHEFRTPLTSIISIAQILLQRLDGDLSVEQERQVRFINESARGLLDLVSDLLDLAKVEAGRVSMKPCEVRADQLFGTLRGVFKPIIAQTSDVELIFEELDEDLVFVSDEGKVSQVLRNLVSNAIKFTERGEVRVSAVREGEEIVFEVADTGVGIASTDLTRIFEDFTQVESLVKNPVKGTGLGLPLSRKLTRLLGGELAVESELGKGSKFHLRLPLEYRGQEEGTLIIHGDQIENQRKGEL